MRFTKAQALAVILLLALSLAACGGDDDDGAEVEVAEQPEFAAGTTMAKLSEAGKVTIGVKYDQPGIGFLEPGADEPSGLDIEIAKIIAAELGIAPEDIAWKETVSDNREPFLQNGTVDMVLASYSITDERRNVVGQAGPYYVTGQQLLVRTEDAEKITGPNDLDGVKVCSVTGSTSIETVTKEYDAKPVPFDTYSDCVTQLQNGSVDAVTTDGAILLGYAAQAPDELKVVGEAFSEERYGVGYKKGDDEMCTFITDTLQTAIDDGEWAKAFEATLGQSGVETPEPPKLDECK
ncbi:MAG TPA: glutamate ABC transporter substrate-binding protein [Solirubrobacteraceae bacterium]|jgi:glutamate transport system substrate-binding protein|nr:glutamate ABC transporter substrate-binding protein [Solirubrobacteraceae bacterium]